MQLVIIMVQTRVSARLNTDHRETKRREVRTQGTEWRSKKSEAFHVMNSLAAEGAQGEADTANGLI